MQSKEVFEVLDQIKATSSRNAKLDILREATPVVRAHIVTLFEYYANPYLLYYITGISDDDVEKYHLSVLASSSVGLSTDFVREDQDLYLFYEVLDKLQSGDFRGTYSKIILAQFLDLYPDMFEFVNDFLNGSWKLGVTSSSIRKVYPELELPHFDVGLCSTFDDQLLEGWYWIDPKFDGLRLIIVPKDGDLQPYSRNGKPLYNCENIINEIKSNLPEEYWSIHVFDGEAFTTDWSSSMSITKTQEEHPDRDKLRYKLFTMVPTKEWVDNDFITSEDDRQSEVQRMFRTVGDYTYLTNYPRIPVDFDDFEDAEQQQEYLNALCDVYEKEGHEGLVLKKADAPYTFGRSEYWIKYKHSYTNDYKIVSVYEGEGRLKGTCGGLNIDIVTDEFGHVECGCGSGLTDEDRAFFWENRNTIADTYVEVKHWGITPEGKLRFPIFQRLRTDKTED